MVIKHYQQEKVQTPPPKVELLDKNAEYSAFSVISYQLSVISYQLSE